MAGQPEGTCDHLRTHRLSELDATVWYCEAVLDDRCVYFLLRPVRGTPDPDDALPSCPLCAIGEVEELTLDHVAPYARRAYPTYMLYDNEAWRTIEYDEEANLALSVEEEDILRNASERTTGAVNSDAAPPPLFINGPAGSGKSTMLSYLYAAYCRRPAQVQQAAGDAGLDEQLLYLTWNDRLLDRARDATRGVLTAEDRADNRTLPSGFEESFKSFHAFVLSLLPPSMRREFSADRRIDYARFRRMYVGPATGKDERDCQYQVNNPPYSADLVWHVVSNLIKGYFPGETMDPDDYAELPRKDRTVSDETFRDIHDSVWSNWYKDLRAKEWWDDRDLVRQVLDQESLPQEYAAIFCDEAQDFTRVELRLLVLVSAFSRYALPPNVASLPFVFAGDPLQTLSPTGFRWKSLTAAFHDELVLPLAGRSALRLGETEVSYNYRSTKPIVRVGNLVQLWRRAWLDLDVKPQKTWHPDSDAACPVLFEIGRNLPLSDVAARTNNTTIIVPCELDEEEEYCRNQEALRSLIPEGGGTPPTVQSPARAKGREFDRVVVYGFGDALPDVAVPPDDDDARLQLEHHLNNLYVALTRAKRELFVIDTEEGCQRLWQASASHASIRQLLEGLGTERTLWEETVAAPGDGNEADSGAMGTGDAKTQAMEYEQHGAEANDADLLRRARDLYLRAGDSDGADRCLAQASELDGDYQEAGMLCLGLQRYRDAARCFWRGAHWPELSNVLHQHPTIEVPSPHARRMLAFMTQNDGSVDVLAEFAEWTTSQLNQGMTFIGTEIQWRSVAEAFVKRLRQAAAASFTDEQSKCAAQVAVRLYEAGLAEADALLLAAANYRAADSPEAAVSLLEGHELNSTDEYFLAQADSAGMSERLKWLDRLDDQTEATKRILAEWDSPASRDAPLEDASALILARHLEKGKRWHDALECHIGAGEVDAAVRCLRQAGARGSAQRRWQSLGSVVALVVERGRFDDALSLLAEAPHPESDDPDYVAVAAHIVRALAQFDGVVEGAELLKRLEDLVKSVEARAREEGLVSDEEIGAALEMTRAIVETLRFYEAAADRLADDAVRLNHMRERWLVVKEQHVKYASLRGRPDEVERVKRDLERRKGEWDISAKGHDDSPVKGLPTGTRLERPTETQLRFDLAGLSVTADTNRAVLLVTTEDLEAVRVKVSSGQHTGDLVVNAIEESDGHVVLGVPDADFKIEMERRDGKQTARLTRREQTVTITFRE